MVAAKSRSPNQARQTSKRNSTLRKSIAKRSGEGCSLPYQFDFAPCIINEFITNEVERSKSEVTEKRYLRKESSLSRKNQLDTMDERSTDKQSVTVERDDSVQDVETSSLSRVQEFVPERLKGGDVSGKKLSVDKKTVEAFQLSSEKIGALEKLLDVDPDTNKKKKWERTESLFKRLSIPKYMAPEKKYHPLIRRTSRSVCNNLDFLLVNATAGSLELGNALRRENDTLQVNTFMNVAVSLYQKVEMVVVELAEDLLLRGDSGAKDRGRTRVVVIEVVVTCSVRIS
ncbi:unnamed protein product [Enterobius vermicularis]|uniref:Condensin complex subunit 2 n=1 Tax=Enterobius vermicularis TaxID=51028 RepID=A0A158QAZ1_ENTVE|nr:unnamed protein product [Enterobius vermicularis]